MDDRGRLREPGRDPVEIGKDNRGFPQREAWDDFATMWQAYRSRG